MVIVCGLFLLCTALAGFWIYSVSHDLHSEVVQNREERKREMAALREDTQKLRERHTLEMSRIYEAIGECRKGLSR